MLSIWKVSYGNDDTTCIDSIGAFHRIELYGNVDVVCYVTNDTTRLIRFLNPEYRKLYYIANKKGSLTISVMQEFEGKPDLPKIEVFTDSLSSVENSYDRMLKITGTVISGSFKAKQQGNGTIMIDSLQSDKVSLSSTAGKGRVEILSGKCCSLACKITGAGSIDARRLEADKVSCRFFGGGEIICNPISALSVFGIGSTKVYYIGNPKVKKFWNKCYRIE